MSIFAGQGDAGRSMALLWAPRAQATGSSPGPKPTLSVEAIVEAGIAVADADTLAGLSMRTVAQRLGRSSMALYTYVPGKAELLDLMYDRVHAEMPPARNLGGSGGDLGGGPDGGPDGGWREAVTAWARELWSLYLRHPWVVQVSYARPVLGPNEQAVMEQLVGILYGAGLDAGTLRGTVTALFHFVRGTAQTVAEARLAAAATGVSDQEWWAGRSALLSELAPDFAERFPMSARLAGETAAGHGDGAVQDPPGDDAVPYLERQMDRTFTVGLTVLLDGIEAAVRGCG
ncbi:TetR/AcrR family transcriptional regulator [Planobispora siamensis]|uniref:TetR family transcriptional regulator n=1 Tax=Planobispora siamensis TaxID=936338 RepID=A0A8J3SJ89_9ACTN|nr:TetR/AcrR family transcriptional regulator C-terminal domain-containing protein [Planobispora siamensis]GIH93576.1 TetR family transcriptional regulator [Planobispora siamensis]